MLLFVCGFPSGGTDLTKTVLNAHPDIEIAGEVPRLVELGRHGFDANTNFRDGKEFARLKAVLADLDTWGNLANLEGADLTQACAGQPVLLVDALREIMSTRPHVVWGSKTPQFTERIRILHGLFPDARYLIVSRDVRDVCLSWHKKWGKDMVLCAHKWATRMAKGLEQVRGLPVGQAIFIRYEALIENPRGTCEEVCRFLGLPFLPSMLEHHRHVDHVVQGKLNYGQPIISGNAGKWRTQVPEATLRRIEEVALPTMRILGYESSLADGHRPIRRSEIRLGRARDLWAGVAVGNRASPNNTLLHRLRALRIQLRNGMRPSD